VRTSGIRWIQFILLLAGFILIPTAGYMTTRMNQVVRRLVIEYSIDVDRDLPAVNKMFVSFGPTAFLVIGAVSLLSMTALTLRKMRYSRPLCALILAACLALYAMGFVTAFYSFRLIVRKYGGMWLVAVNLRHWS